MASINSQNAIEGMLSAVCDSFHANMKTALLERLQAALDAELEKIVEEEAKRITDVVASYYKNPMDMSEVLHLRLMINRQEVCLDSN